MKISKSLFSKTAILSFLVFSAITFFSCQNPDGGSATPQIDSFGWVVENIDQGYWNPTSVSGHHLFYNFMLHYTGTISASKIKEARVEVSSEGYYWKIPDSLYNTSANIIGGYERFIDDSDLTDEGNFLPVVELKGVIEFTDGTSIKKVLDPNIPNTIGNDGFTHVYSESASYIPADNPMAIAIPTLSSASSNPSEVTLAFDTHDARVFNAWVWFYDSDSNYVGIMPPFKDDSNGAIYSGLNGGAGFNSPATTNTVMIDVSDIEFEDSKSVEDIAFAVVLSSDGSQYVSKGHYANFDYRGLSARYPVVYSSGSGNKVGLGPALRSFSTPTSAATKWSPYSKDQSWKFVPDQEKRHIGLGNK